MLEAVSAIINNRLKPLFPPANYGWAGAMSQARVDKWQNVMVSFPANAPAYSCHSASLEAVRALREAELPALLARLSLLFKEGGNFTHYLAVVPEPAGFILIGLTPLDRLIGLALPQPMSAREFAAFSRKFSCQFLEFSDAGDRAIVLTPKYSFPFRIRQEKLIVYSRFCGYQFGRGYNLELCASALGFDRQDQKLTGENSLSFTYSIPCAEKAGRPSGNLAEDIGNEPANWDPPDGFSLDDLNSRNPIIRAIVEDWRDLSSLAVQLRTI